MTNGKAKQLVVLSGKGGTGKTSIVAAFAHLSANSPQACKTVFVDADVDAANLSLVLAPTKTESHEFWGSRQAIIDEELCSGCGSCVGVCRYDAIFLNEDTMQTYWIDPIACDGCGACVYACPVGAIHMEPQQEGFWFQSETASGKFFHAELFPGRENSGKLVTLIKQFAKLEAEENQADLIVIDGPPGIGCPVISACAGTDLGLIITEPSQAGLHDLQRVLGTLKHFRIPTVLCINKADLYPQGTADIHAYAEREGVQIIGEIPFDESVPHAMINGVAITDQYPDSPAAVTIRKIWNEVITRFIKEEA